MTNQELYARVAWNVFPTRDMNHEARRVDTESAIQQFREQVRKEARDEFEEAIYKHIDTISEESEKFRDDTFRSVGYSVRISAIRETLDILSQLPII